MTDFVDGKAVNREMWRTIDRLRLAGFLVVDVWLEAIDFDAVARAYDRPEAIEGGVLVYDDRRIKERIWIYRCGLPG